MGNKLVDHMSIIYDIDAVYPIVNIYTNSQRGRIFFDSLNDCLYFYFVHKTQREEKKKSLKMSC